MDVVEGWEREVFDEIFVCTGPFCFFFSFSVMVDVGGRNSLVFFSNPIPNEKLYQS